MKTLSTIVLLSILLLSGCGGGGGNEETQTAVSTPENTVENDVPTISFEEFFSLTLQSPLQSPLPLPSVNADKPVISDYPDVLFAVNRGVERFDLIVETDFNLNAVLFAEENATSYSRLDIHDCCNAPSSDGRLGISIQLQLDAIAFGCYEMAVEDQRALVSDPVQICLIESALPSGDRSASGRLILFANFSSNSELSTVSLSDREVTVIGSTGVSLTDIAWQKLTLVVRS